jgi:UPF0755 protein
VKRLLILLVLLVVAGAGVAIPFYVLPARYKGFSEPVIVEVAHGKSVSAIASDLARVGVIRSPYLLLLARAFHRNAILQAGEYEFAKPASPNEVLDRLVRGEVVHYEVTIPEGSNIFDIAAAVGRIPFLKSDKMLEAMRNPALIRDLDPVAPTLEGYLFPSTYRLARYTTEEQLCHMMVSEFRKVWKQQQAEQGASVHDVVTLASLVEKESAAKDERPVVAAVYRNRLEKGMRLECDPTTIYAAMLMGRYRGKIHRSDLDSENPFNTYRHAGLPPGPIANPGAASIAAALNPAESKYLFFVARPDGSGRHNFAVDLATHNRNVAEYRRGIAQTK